MQLQEQHLTVGFHECLEVSLSLGLDDLWTNGTRWVSGDGPHSFGTHEPLCCVHKSAPLLRYVCGGAESQLGCQINYLKITQGVIRDMKRHAKNKHGSEKASFKPRFLSSTSCVWFQGQCGCTEWYYRAKNARLPFLARVLQRWLKGLRGRIYYPFPKPKRRQI